MELFCIVIQIYKKEKPRLIVAFSWHSHRESNPELALRRGLLYPFNYESLYRIIRDVADLHLLFLSGKVRDALPVT